MDTYNNKATDEQKKLYDKYYFDELYVRCKRKYNDDENQKGNSLACVNLELNTKNTIFGNKKSSAKILKLKKRIRTLSKCKTKTTDFQKQSENNIIKLTKPIYSNLYYKFISILVYLERCFSVKSKAFI